MKSKFNKFNTERDSKIGFSAASKIILQPCQHHRDRNLYR